MKLLHLSFCLALVCVYSADVQQAKTIVQMELSERQVKALKLMDNMDLDLLQEIVAVSQKEKPSLIGNNGFRRKGRSNRSRKLKDGLRRLEGDTTVTDTMWLLICGTFVFFMHAGFAMLETGNARAKSAQAILIKNLITVCMGTVGWYLLGWSLAYGGDVKTANWEEGSFEDCDMDENPMGCGDGYADNGFIGGAGQFAGSGFLGKGEETDKAWAEGVITPSGLPTMWFFQWAFCTAGCSIVSGGVAERIRFPAYMLFAFCMTSFIYPVVVCSTWGYGWLETFKKDSKGNPIAGYIDFAGSGVVHLTGGIGALAGASILGARKGRFDPEKEDEFQPHSFPLIVIGTFILWFGWCGFNPGSTLAMGDAGTAMKAAVVMMNTTITAAVGGVTVFSVMFALTKKYDCGNLCNGILAGLVSITAGCSNVESGSAFLIGIIGGVIFVGSSALIKKLKIDDPVDAFSVHGACGIWGCIAAAVFDFGAGTDKHHGWGGFSATSWSEDGETKYMSTGDAFAANMVEVLFVIIWSGGLSACIFGALKVAGILRIPSEVEELGTDSECASPKSYNITQVKPAP